MGRPVLMLTVPVNALTPVPSNLLDRVCLVQYGQVSAANRNRLREALYAHHRNMGVKSISRQSISYWFTQKNRQVKRRQAMAFLYTYLTNNVPRDSITDDSTRQIYDQLLLTLNSRANVLSTGEAISNILPMTPGDRLVAGNGIQYLTRIMTGTSRDIRHNELTDLFYTSLDSSTDDSDQSYYLVYRYSTEGGVIKSFLVCKQPEGGEDNFTFVQFLRGERTSEDGAIPIVFRENVGIILKCPKSYYWLGYNYTVPVYKRDDHYANLRIRAKLESTGIEVIVVEYDDLVIDKGLFPGLMTTVAALHQPVIARVAILHLGTKKSLGRYLTDEVTTPKELKADCVSTDLRSIIGRMQEIGCKRFGRILDLAIREDDWKDRGANNLTKRILRMINNMPAWEENRNKENQNKEPSHARGAIETFSSLYPRPRY
jgi:hypothetical protein